MVSASQRCSMVVSVWAMFMAHGVGALAGMVKGAKEDEGAQRAPRREPCGPRATLLHYSNKD